MAFLKNILKEKNSADRERQEKKEKREASPNGGVAHSARAISGVLLLPRVTEKTARAAGSGTYTFSVARNVNKRQIKDAVETRYRVSVLAVRVLHSPAKERHRGKQIGWKPGFKKAMITLKEGQSIETP